MVKVSGFGVGSKVWLSECASPARVTDLGCGQQPARQTMLLTGNNRAGSGFFVVHDRASVKAYDTASFQQCTSRCVLVATAGDFAGYANVKDYADAGLSFGPTRSSSSLPSIAANATDRFVGQWYVHDAQLAITSNAAGVESSNCGGGVCVETEDLSLSLSANAKRMTATITKVSYRDGTTGKAIRNPDPAESSAVGDSFYLGFVAPHLVKMTILHTSLPAIDQKYGNPYWCGNGLARALEDLCGA